MPSSGRLAAVKLVRLYGYVSCKTSVGVDNWTYWGCGYSQVQHKVNVVITTSTNRILFPPNQLLSSTHGGEGKWHHIIGYNSWSQSLSCQFSLILTGSLTFSSYVCGMAKT
ncbi:unnamed protein product [Porites evermanni]|uniref:Uncharacterized protein n=1 Tax=Porites evermanni TaxID=104178 RepID=A0ABN8M503_9CNID|nr:unnamed protein product [Porites evermanni]